LKYKIYPKSYSFKKIPNLPHKGATNSVVQTIKFEYRKKFNVAAVQEL